MSSDSESAPGPAVHSVPAATRKSRLSLLATALLTIVAVAGAFIGGCIRRYPAPTEAPAAPAPYSAVATWRAVRLPALDGEGGKALPAAALRLSFDGEGRPWMDSSLVDGRDAATTYDRLEPALRVLSQRPEPIVLIGIDRLPCAQLLPFGGRIHVAGGRSAYETDLQRQGKHRTPRPESESLRSLPLERFCPGSGDTDTGGMQDSVQPEGPLSPAPEPG